MRRIELLEVCEHDSSSGFAGLLQPSRHQGSLAHLARPFHQDDAIVASHRGIKFLVGGTNNIELGMERQSSRHGFKIRLAAKCLRRSL